MRHRLLLVDDDKEHCEALATTLRLLGYDVEYTTSAREALDRVGRETFAAILTDLGMSEMGGLELCSRILGTRPDVPVIVVSGNGTVDAAVSAMRAGAYDFLVKPIDVGLLTMNVARAVNHHLLQAEVKELEEASLERAALGGLVGGSIVMRRMCDLVARVAASDISVLVEGETGTGKEVVARALHAAGARRRGPFVALNCSSIPASLLESELFGHVRGSFTGASTSRGGLLVKASGGTLLLDEIGDMPLGMQTKLLRAIEERRVRPVGSTEEEPFDARIIAATHRTLETEVATGRFREDLYYRINVVRIRVPPLRERDGDILRLARHFLESFAIRAKRGEMQLSQTVAAALLGYDWPGNVRELENSMERAVALARSSQVGMEDIADKIVSPRASPFTSGPRQVNEILTLEEVDRRYIARAITLVAGNKSRAADLLGLDRRTLYRRLEKYDAAARRTADAAQS